MSDQTNDSISLDDLIAAVGNAPAESPSKREPAEKAPSLDLLSALGLESLPDENDRPVFYSEREERERRREAQRREQQIRSQQWQRELREIEAKKAQIGAERPIRGQEPDQPVSHTVAMQAEPIEPRIMPPRQSTVPRYEGGLFMEQPIPEPDLKVAQELSASQGAPASMPQPMQMPSQAQPMPQSRQGQPVQPMPAMEPQAVPESAQAQPETAPEQPAAPRRADQPHGEVRQASFSTLPQKRAFIAPLSSLASEPLSSIQPLSQSAVEPIGESGAPAGYEPPAAFEETAPAEAAPLGQATPEEAYAEAAPAPSPEAAPTSAPPARRMSFSDYRAGQISITPLRGPGSEEESTSVLSNANISLTEEKSTRLISQLITQDHSQEFIEPSEAMNTMPEYPDVPEVEYAEEYEESAYEDGRQDFAGDASAEADFTGEIAEEASAEDYDAEAEDVSDDASEEPADGPQFSRRAFPASGTSSFSTIEPQLIMPVEEGVEAGIEQPAEEAGYEQTSDVYASTEGTIEGQYEAEPAGDVYYEQDAFVTEVPYGDGYQTTEEVEGYGLEEPLPQQTYGVSPEYQAAVEESEFLRGSAEPTRKPTLRQVEQPIDPNALNKGSKSRVVGIVLIVVAAICALVAVVLFSGILNFDDPTEDLGADNGASNDSVPAAVYETTGADTATYSYVVRGPDGSTHEATEEAVFDEDGVLIESTITVGVDNQEMADALLEQLRDEFGDSVMDYKATDNKVIVVLDIARNDLTKEIYTELLSANMAEFKVLE